MLIALTLLVTVVTFTWACATFVEAYIWDLNQRYIGNLQTELAAEHNEPYHTMISNRLAIFKQYEEQLHKGLFLIKSLFFIMLFTLIFITFNWQQALLLCVSYFCFYFFYHQFFLYFQRNKLNTMIYLQGGYSNASKSSQSNLDKRFPFIGKYWFRLAVLAVGLVLFLIAVV